MIFGEFFPNPSGKPLTDDKATLDDNGIKHKDTIDLEPMIVYVRTPQGDKLTYEVDPADTILDMKHRVEGSKGIPVNHQRMAFKGRPLTNDKASLDSKGIKHKGNFSYLGYNPPFQLINRTNEVVVEIDHTSLASR